MRLKILGSVLAIGVLAQSGLAQDPDRAETSEIERKLEALQREVEQLKRQQGGVGWGGTSAPDSISGGYNSAAEIGLALPQDDVGSRENEKVKIGGKLDFQFFDSRANRNNLGNYGGNQFGLNGGSTEFRIRELQLNFDLELIEDFVFRSTLTLDPVVRDQDEGSVDIDEAYVRFSNIVRNLFGFEDPSHSYIQAGNYYRWERDFLFRFSQVFSLAGTSFYRDEVTGLAIGGDFEEGFFYRVSLDNGSQITVRDAGDGINAGAGGSATGNSPIFHDNEMLGDLNNNKDFAVGLGIKSRVEEPAVQYGLGVSYRAGRLSAIEQGFLAASSPTYNGGSSKRRLGVLGTLEWDAETVILGGNAEFWVARDGNGDREAYTLSPYLKLPLDGVYYQKRLFFTGIGLGYMYGRLHQSNGFANQTALTSSILDDKGMHTVDFWIDVTRNVDLKFEVTNVRPSNRGRSETEWLMQWSIRF